MVSSLQKKLARLSNAGPGSTPALRGQTPSDTLSAEQPAAPTARSARIAALQKQLDRVVVTGRATTTRAKEPPSSSSDILARLLRDAPALATDEPDGVLPGEGEETPFGHVHYVRQWLEPAHCHGRAPVAAALDAESELVARLALDPTLKDLDLKRMLLIDTETTGLSTGAGTIPFLVGIGFFEDQSLCVEQMLLLRRRDEPAMLRNLAERIAASSCLVSYNGKSFDWPLLRSRFVMNRVPTPPIPPHIDLLHCARRAFKRRLRSMRLVEMEKEILGMVREHDVGGAEIPGIYLTFLRSGNPGRLDGVIEHNGHDLVALASFLGEIVRRFKKVQREDDPLDHLSYALIAEKAGDRARATEFSTAAAAGGGDDACSFDAFLLMARTARREKDFDAQERALLAATKVGPDPRVHFELAKFYEHRRKDYVLARHFAERTAPLEDNIEREKRLGRIERKRARTTS
ncbi:MAG: ribonuclease H-like domain-containing protein [Polyangiales bacterium]